MTIIWSRCLHGPVVPASEKDQLERLASEALAQACDKEYSKSLEDRDITDIVRYGIAFSGKDVEIVTDYMKE